MTEFEVAAYIALQETVAALSRLELWIGHGMLTGHRARVQRLLGRAPESVRKALEVFNAEVGQNSVTKA